MPELRRLLWRFVLAVPHTARHILAWSQWRQHHQRIAQYDHYKRREVKPRHEFVYISADLSRPCRISVSP